MCFVLKSSSLKLKSFFLFKTNLKVVGNPKHFFQLYVYTFKKKHAICHCKINTIFIILSKSKMIIEIQEEKTF